MYKIKYILFLFITLLFVSCDIAGRLVVKNKTKEDINIRIYYNNTIYHDSLIHESLYSVKDDIKEIKLPDKSGRNLYKETYDFGFSWTDENIKNLVTDIDSIEVVIGDYKTIIDNKDELFHFYKKYRRGPFGKNMNIVIKK